MKILSKCLSLFLLIATMCSCSNDSSLPEKFAEAFLKGDTKTCVKIYPGSEHLLRYINPQKLKNYSDLEKKHYYEKKQGQEIEEISFTLNGVEWIINAKKHTISQSHGLFSTKDVINTQISEHFYEKHPFFEKNLEEHWDVIRANRLNSFMDVFLPSFTRFWKLLNALKDRDSDIIRNEIPELHPFINRSFSNGFKNDTLKKEWVYFEFDKGKVKELKYYGQDFRITYYSHTNDYYVSGLFDSSEFEKEYANFPIKVNDEGLTDNGKVEFINHANDYINISKKYIDAVNSNNTEIANRLYPKGSFITSTTIKKNIGAPSYYDGRLHYSSGCSFVFNNSNGEIIIDETYGLYDYSSYYSQYLSMSGATKLDRDFSTYDRWNYEAISDAIKNLSAKNSERIEQTPQRSIEQDPQRSQNINPGMWKKDFLRDEFGNKNESVPYIYQIWSGKRNNTFDCELFIRIADNVIEFIILEDYQHPDLFGVTITGQLNGNKFPVPYDKAEEQSVYIVNKEGMETILNALDTDGLLMLSFRKTNALGDAQNYLFKIAGSTNVSGAIQKFLFKQ